MTISLLSQNLNEPYRLYFKTDCFEINPGDFPQLNLSTSDTVIINAYCDWRGDEAYNRELSKKRAEAVQNWIKTIYNLDSGVVWQRNAFGENHPAGADVTWEGMKINRRADVFIRRKPEIQAFEIQPVMVGPEEGAFSLNEELKNSLSTGKNMRIRNLNFKPGLDIIVPQSEAVLNELFKLMQSNPELEIELQGYVCCTEDGRDGSNYRNGSDHLSRDRAKTVYDFLVSKCIEEKRMDYKGYGGSNKIANPERTSEDQNMNRRVEIRIKKN